MSLDALLLDILVDPIDRGPLSYLEARQELYNPRTKTIYVIVDSIPVLLPDEGRALDDDEVLARQDELATAPSTGGGRR